MQTLKLIIKSYVVDRLQYAGRAECQKGVRRTWWRRRWSRFRPVDAVAVHVEGWGRGRRMARRQRSGSGRPVADDGRTSWWRARRSRRPWRTASHVQ